MWVLTQTHPKSSRADIRAATSTFLVQTDDARPYSEPLAIRSASSSSLNFCTVSTGPKISVRISSSSWFRSATTVGS